MEAVLNILLILAMVIGLVAIMDIPRKIAKSTNRELAKLLGWNYKAENFRNDSYFFLSKIQRVKEVYCLSGIYKNVKFKLFEIGFQYLGVELEDDHKFYGFQLVTKGLTELRMNRFGRELRMTSLESNEFLKEFQLFSVNQASAYFDLDPDSMAKLLDVRHQLYQFGLEAKANKVLIYGHYAPFVKLQGNSGGAGLETKKQVLLEFLEIAYKINNALK